MSGVLEARVPWALVVLAVAVLVGPSAAGQMTGIGQSSSSFYHITSDVPDQRYLVGYLRHHDNRAGIAWSPDAPSAGLSPAGATPAQPALDHAMAYAGWTLRSHTGGNHDETATGELVDPSTAPKAQGDAPSTSAMRP